MDPIEVNSLRSRGRRVSKTLRPGEKRCVLRAGRRARQIPELSGTINSFVKLP